MDKFRRKTSIDTLLKVGFLLDLNHSNFSSNVYFIRFPIYKYMDRVLLECEVRVNDENMNVDYEIFQAGTRNLYNIQYRDYGNVKPLRDLLEKRIEKKFKSLGFKKATKTKNKINKENNKNREKD